MQIPIKRFVFIKTQDELFLDLLDQSDQELIEHVAYGRPIEVIGRTRTAAFVFKIAKNITSNKLDFKYEVIYRSVGEEVPYHLRILIDWNKL